MLWREGMVFVIFKKISNETAIYQSQIVVDMEIRHSTIKQILTIYEIGYMRPI